MIKIVDHEGPVSLERIQYVESQIGVKLPKSYIDFILPNDEAYIEPGAFLYFDESFQEKAGAGVGVFLKIGESKAFSDLLSKNIRLQSYDFFPDGLMAFSQDGGGNLLCFDYRKGKDSLDPPIVYWNHEAEEGKDVSFLANNFEAFLKILKTDEEMDALLK